MRRIRNRSKYGSKFKVVDGIKFRSISEADRYSELKLLERAGVICGLTLQPPFTIRIRDTVVGKYVADFHYFEGDRSIFEDVKGMKTALYRFKKKCVEAQYGITITEISPKHSRVSLSKTQERKAAA